MLESRWLWAALLGAIGVTSCADLSAIPPDVCGNGFVEANEDCDTTDPSCRQPEELNPCRWSCTKKSDCPKDAQGQDAGWGCGTDHVCRRPLLCSSPSSVCATFKAAGVVPETAARLLVADFDGSGRKSVLSAASPLVSVHYFDDDGLLVKTNSIVAPDASPAAGNLTSDNPAADESQRADFTLDVSRGLEVIRGSSDRVLQSTPYASVSVPIRGQVVPIAVPLSDDPSALDLSPPRFVLFPEDAARHTSGVITRTASGEDRQLFSFEGGGGVLAGNVVVDNFLSTLLLPCQQLAVAFEGASSVSIASPCKAGNAPNSDGDADYIKPVSIKLPAGGTICKGCQAVHALDLNADLAPDLVISGSMQDQGAIFTAYNLKNGHFSSTPGGAEDDSASQYPVNFQPLPGQPPLAGERAHDPPIAVGDVNMDCALDFVNSVGLYLSYFDTPVPTDCSKPTGFITFSTFEDDHYWSSAAIADMTGDGIPDVAVGSDRSPGITLYRNTGLLLFNPSKLVTSGPVKRFTVGDFDGDTHLDLALSEVADLDDSSAGREALAIAFGSDGGLSQPVVMGEIDAVQNLMPTHVLGVSLDFISDLLVVSQSPAKNGPDILLFPGTSERQLQAPYYLLKSAAGAPDFPKQSTIGQFDDDPHNDIAVFGWQPCYKDPSMIDCAATLWLVPSTGQAQIEPIGGPRGPQSTPLQFTGEGDSLQPLHEGVLMASVDLDPKQGSALGTDEVVLVAGGGPPSLYVARASGGKFEVGPPIKLEQLGQPMDPEQIRSMQLLVADVDGDGDADVVLSSRSGVLVLWNQGQGGLDLSGAAFLSAGEILQASCGRKVAEPLIVRGVGALNVDTTPAKELVVVTRDATYLLHTSGGSLVPSCLPAVPGGISVAGGDIDGDGVDDIVLGRTGAVEVFRATAAGAGAGDYTEAEAK